MKGFNVNTHIASGSRQLTCNYFHSMICYMYGQLCCMGILFYCLPVGLFNSCKPNLLQWTIEQSYTIIMQWIFAPYVSEILCLINIWRSGQRLRSPGYKMRSNVKSTKSLCIKLLLWRNFLGIKDQTFDHDLHLSSWPLPWPWSSPFDLHLSCSPCVRTGLS